MKGVLHWSQETFQKRDNSWKTNTILFQHFKVLPFKNLIFVWFELVSVFLPLSFIPFSFSLFHYLPHFWKWIHSSFCNLSSFFILFVSMLFLYPFFLFLCYSLVSIFFILLTPLSLISSLPPHLFFLLSLKKKAQGRYQFYHHFIKSFFEKNILKQVFCPDIFGLYFFLQKNNGRNSCSYNFGKRDEGVKFNNILPATLALAD